MVRHQKVVIDEMLTKPSAVCPTLFVGLGGCGCRLVSRVAKHLQRRPDYEERYKALVKFAMVDTNVNELEGFRELADSTFLISDFEKEEYADLASGKLFLEADPYFTQWVPQNYRFRAGDTAGAGQIRIESRLGVFYQMKHKDFVSKFRKLLEDLKSHEHGHRRLDSQEIRIVLCYSVAGGTGSGCHLPIAYMLRDQASELGKPRVIGVAVQPAVFEDKTGINRDGTFANAYAALKETEYLMKLGAPDSRFYPEDGIPFHYDPSNVSKRTVRQPPFDFVYIVDKPQSFTVPDPVDAAADGLYLQFFSPLYGHQASDYDNFTQHQRFLVPHDFETKGIVGFTTFYGSYGAAVLLVPVDGLVDYCSQAAALSLMRASFLRSIPGDMTYATLRNVPEPFFEVALGNEKNEKPVHVADFHKKEKDQRERLVDRLYMKRVRLLAACELEDNEIKRFFTLFRHGHRAGEVPRPDGTGWDLKPERVKEDQEQLARNGMRLSIGAIVLPAITSDSLQELPGLLQQARKAMELRAEEDSPTAAGINRVYDARTRASVWLDELKSVGVRILKNGYKVGTVKYPGMDSLVELSFLNDEAGEVDLAAKRYAVLSILERVRWDIKLQDRTADFDLGDHKDTDKLKANDVPALLESLQSQAIDRAMEIVTQLFIEGLGDLRANLDKFAVTQRNLEDGFDQLETEQLNRLRKLREDGGKGSSANQYVLDAEALQAEDGRRLWDFYFEDQIAGLPELSLSNREIQVLLSDTVTAMSVRRGGATSADLDKLFTALREHVVKTLGDRIGGDPHSPDRERRDGLTLSDALELEVAYRALYRSNSPQVEAGGDKTIRELISSYRFQKDEQLDLRDDKHSDYLRDKIKRLVKEKASLLCVYEEGRDQHGGVRPDNVFVAAIDENFKNSTIEESIRGADPNLTWVTTGWSNPKEIIFYRAVLNVPLYVFGRMKEMKAEYERFKSLAKRPKVLHIDHNWEDTLPDLDPDSAQENHRQELLRNHVINFAALMTTRRADGGSTFIVRRAGKYCLTDPNWDGLSDDGEFGDDGLTRMGETLADSIQKLPEVLESEKVTYLPYQQMLRAVREGLAPEVLAAVVDLPFRWRSNHDELRNKYGPNRTPEQQEKLKDYADAYQRLREALEKLYDRLSNVSVEQRTLGEDLGANAANLMPEEAEANLVQSLRILETFCEVWKALENPDQPGAVAKSFQRLFKPLPENKLNQLLERLRSSPSRPGARRPLAGTGGPVEPAPGGTAAAAMPTNGPAPGDIPARS